MPTYSYRCNECGHEFDIRQKFSDDPLTECPRCHGDIRRVVNSVGVLFKGSGFYVTDNRNGRSSTAPAPSASDSSESSGEKSSDSAKEKKETSSKTAVSDKSSSST